MLFAVDIDGTIAGLIDWMAEGVVPTFLEYARTIGLALPAQVGEDISDGRSFLHLPEIIAARQACPDQWKAALRDFRASSAGMEHARVMPEAVKGVRQLAQVGQVSYYTVRQGNQQDVQAITRRWLSTRGFPHPDRVVFCRSVMNKLLRLARHIETMGEEAVLIDDLCTLLLEQFEQLAAGNHPALDAAECQQVAECLRTHLIFVAFGGDAHVREQPHHDVRVLTLPSWEDVADVLATFQSPFHS